MVGQGNATEISRKIVKRFYECVVAADFEGALSCFHPDIEMHEPECLPYGGMYHGKEGVLKLFGGTVSKLLDVKTLRVDAIIAEGDRVVGILRVGVVGTSEPAMVAEEFLIRDGKIFKLNIFYFDPTRVGNAAKR